MGAVEEGKNRPRSVVDGARGGINGGVDMRDSATTPTFDSLVKTIKQDPTNWVGVKIN